MYPFITCELWVERVGTFGVALYRKQLPVNFILYFGELHSDSSIRYKITLFEHYTFIPKCYIVKQNFISLIFF